MIFDRGREFQYQKHVPAAALLHQLREPNVSLHVVVQRKYQEKSNHAHGVSSEGARKKETELEEEEGRTEINKDRIKAHERQQRYRDRKKMAGVKETVQSNEKKRKLLTRSGREKQRDTIMRQVVKTNRMVKTNIIRKLSFLKKYRLNRTLSTSLGVNDSVITKLSVGEQQRQIRKDATSEEDKHKIQDFFLRADTSTNLPATKRVKKDMQERRVLDRPLVDAYREFKESN
ncbi:hypothetical protein MAR_006150 [Mya arenaria]|uniref:Uncharacterized protein n=1 Tax=Mya arenaria TaxID=6604 RepID=A0ABY7DBB6_MYAAR|nr:hypothetical protein MAR_006150 [Mya arenaria]